MHLLLELRTYSAPRTSSWIQGAASREAGGKRREEGRRGKWKGRRKGTGGLCPIAKFYAGVHALGASFTVLLREI